MLAVVQALLTSGPLWHVGGVLAGLDRPTLTLVLAAFAHAAGSHEQAEAAVPGDWLSLRIVGPVVPWPEGVAA